MVMMSDHKAATLKSVVVGLGRCGRIVRGAIASLLDALFASIAATSGDRLKIRWQ